MSPSLILLGSREATRIKLLTLLCGCLLYLLSLVQGGPSGHALSNVDDEFRSCAPCTRWGGHLFQRLCSMFPVCSPCLLGQHGSCSTAQQPGNSQKTIYKTFGTSGRPTYSSCFGGFSCQAQLQIQCQHWIVNDQMDRPVFSVRVPRVHRSPLPYYFHYRFSIIFYI